MALCRQHFNSGVLVIALLHCPSPAISESCWWQEGLTLHRRQQNRV